MTNDTICKIAVSTLNCHVCGKKYYNMFLGKKHVYAVCNICERQDEVGLVWNVPRTSGVRSK